MLSQPSSFVPIKGLDIVELGCGLGAVGISAALAGARSVLLTDFQPASLELARASAEANGVSDRVQTCLLDWTDPGSTLQERAVDLVIGSDVLYSRELSASLMDVVAALLVLLVCADAPSRVPFSSILLSARRARCCLSCALSADCTGVVRCL